MLKTLHSLLSVMCTAFTLVSVPGVSLAQPLTPEQWAEVDRVEAYLSELETVQARFVQTSSLGGFAEGTFYLKRPGRMRIEYEPPVPYLYVADGVWLTFYDGELDQRWDALLGTTLADFVVREDVDFGGDVLVRDVRHSDGHLRVDVLQAEDPQGGRLTLIFEDADAGLSLVAWEVLDAQNVVTRVDLLDRQVGIELSGRLFTAPRPDR